MRYRQNTKGDIFYGPPVKFKFPGRQKIFVSDKWGFTKFSHEDYDSLMQKGQLQYDGADVKYLLNHGPLEYWKRRQVI